MDEEEIRGQLRELTGDTYVACERCGRVVSADTVRAVNDMRVCPDCQRPEDADHEPLEGDEE